MNRFRGTDVALGLVAVAVNVGLVVGVVSMTGGEASEAPPRAAGTPSASASPSPSPTPTPSGSSSSSGAAAPSARSLLTGDDPVSVAVLGDQTGDGETEWVAVLASLLGTDHEVVLRDLDPSDPTVYAGERRFGSDGPQVAIYNGSRAGVKADYAARRLPLLVPVRADLVVLSYGRNDAADKVARRLERTADAVRTEQPGARLVVTLQPPTTGDGQQEVRDAVRRWARSSKVSVLDIASAFRETGEPDAYVSGRDPLVMSSLGDRLWGETAYRLLTGRPVPTQEPAVVTDPAEAPTTTVDGLVPAPVVTEPDPTRTAEPTPTPTRDDPTPDPTGTPWGPGLTPDPEPTPVPTPTV